MATYTGDAQIVDVFIVTGSTSTPNTTITLYTCPAGQFADVHIHAATATETSGGGGANSSFNVGGVNLVSVNGATASVNGMLETSVTRIEEGQTIQAVMNVSAIGNASGTCCITEYNKP